MGIDPLTEAQLRLAAIVANSDDAIMGEDLFGTITSWNQAAERLFGYSTVEAVGQPTRLVIPAEYHPEEDYVLEKVRAGEAVDHRQTIRVHKNGRRVDVSVTVVPIVVASGEVVGASQIARDITEQRRLERAASHFAAIVDSSDDASISKDLDGIVVSWNRAAEMLFGYSASEMVGQSIRMILPADRQEEEDRVLESVRRGEAVEHFETIRQRKDGRPIPISLTVSPIRSQKGEIIGASKIARDLSGSQRIQGDAQRLAAIVDSSDDAIASKDLNSIVTSWNRAAEGLFGFSADEMIGQSIRLLIPDDRQSEEDEVMGRIRQGLRVEHYETIRRRKDGTMVPVSLTVSPIVNPQGVVIGASKIARDISDRKQADADRQRLLQMAREANQLKDEFLATLSHELRTPLNAIVGYLRMMQAGLLDAEKYTRAVDTVVRNVTSLTQIVEDVLDVSRIVSGKLRLDVRAVHLSVLVHEVVETIRPAAEAKQIKLQVIVDPGTPAVSGDPERMRQVLWNVCSNAVKFTEKRGRIQIRLERVNSHVEVIVNDNGVGMSEEFLPHVFERFRQADASSSREYGGLGLGLAISRHLVEMQGGRIFADSGGPGKGSTFRIELPIRSVFTGDHPSMRQHPGAPAGQHSINVPKLDGVRVLAIDDDRDALALIREILEVTGATVITADSADDGLDKLKRMRVDVLIADLGMPHMDGFTLIERIRQSDAKHNSNVPAAALTAFARSEDRTRALRSGFQMHLAKPIEPGELMAAAATLARQSAGDDPDRE